MSEGLTTGVEKRQQALAERGQGGPVEQQARSGGSGAEPQWKRGLGSQWLGFVPVSEAK